MNNKIKCLIIEDDEQLLMLLCELLNIYFYDKIDFITANTLQKAKNILKNELIDMVLTDCNLPDGNACDVLPYIDDKPLIVMTGYLDREKKDKIKDITHIKLLMKPFQLRELTKIIDKIFEENDW